ncbi:hypothetical protein ACVIKO_005634 [Rhizobium ruizarguesonis]
MAPHRNPPLPTQQQQPKTAGANSKLDKTWGQGQRLAKAAAVHAGRYAHARQFRRIRRELKRLRTSLGCVLRDIGRKVAGNVELERTFARLFALIERLLAQKPKDKNKVYSLHAPEVACFSKGKACHSSSVAR